MEGEFGNGRGLEGKRRGRKEGGEMGRGAAEKGWWGEGEGGRRGRWRDCGKDVLLVFFSG
jgi:hypothetical protein